MELLSPAGDPERLRYALHYGADAVYIGYKEFGMRSSCGNFDYDDIREAVRLCRSLGKRLYVTVNIFPYPGETERMIPFFREMEKIRPDAFIIADIGVMALARRYAPDVAIHISTQANVTAAPAAVQYYEMGASRVVLARELSLEQIAAIRRDTPRELEIECFVHGAMCMSVSGRCHLSRYLTGRDAGHGACTQPCRWEYAVTERTREGLYFPVEQTERGSFIFNANDLCMISHLKELEEAGVTACKIEGRAKTFYYVAAVTAAYRRALDEIRATGGLQNAEKYEREVRKVSHRPYSTGFYFSPLGGGAEIRKGGYERTYEVVATVLDGGNGRARVTQKNKFSAGDTLEVLSPGKDPAAFTVGEMRTEDGAPVTDAPHAEQTLVLSCGLPLSPMDILRRKKEEG